MSDLGRQALQQQLIQQQHQAEQLVLTETFFFIISVSLHSPFSKDPGDGKTNKAERYWQKQKQK